MLEIPDNFWVNGRCWVRAYVYGKKLSTPPPLGTSTVQYILTPSIIYIMDMPLLYSISSLKSVTDMRGSSDFCLGGGGGRTESDRNRLRLLFGTQTYLQWVQSPQLVYRGFNRHFQRKLYFLVPKGSKILQGWGSNSIAFIFPIELVIFKVIPGHLPPPPTSSLGPCMTDPSQNDRVSCLNNELCLVCIALIFFLQK